MKRWFLLLLLAGPLLAQTKESLEQRTSPKPSGTAGDIPYAVNTTTIGWIPHATGLQCLTQNGTATPVWAACTSGASPLTTKGDIYVYSTLDTRLPVGTNGYVLESDSTQTTGLKWVDPNVSSTGWVKLQSSYPGSQQVGHFNVDGSSGAGPMTLTYSPSSAGVPGTYDLLTMNTDAAVVANSRYRMLFGDPSFTDRQLSFSYLAATYSGGNVGSWNLVRSDKNIGGGITLMQKNSDLHMTMCIATDMASGSGYPAVCDTAFGIPLAVGVIGTNPGFTVTATGDISTIHGATYSWPLTVPVGASCLRSSTGVLSWDSACGTGGTGGVTSVGLSLPSIFTVSGSPVTSTGTLTGTLATQTANTIFAGPTTGAAATPAFRTLVSADIPNNAADTTGKSGSTDALNTTTTAVNVALSAAPPGAGYSCVTTDATHCTWQLAAGTGTVTSIATTAPITGGTITTTGTIAISSFASTAPSPGAVPDATAAAAGSYLDKSGTWTVPSGGSGYSGTTWIHTDPNFTIPASYERLGSRVNNGPGSMIALLAVGNWPVTIANAISTTPAGWTWLNTTNLTSADENTTTANALRMTHNTSATDDFFTATYTAPRLFRSLQSGLATDVIARAKIGMTQTGAAAIMTLQNDCDTCVEWCGASWDTNGIGFSYRSNNGASHNYAGSEKTNGLWVLLRHFGSGCSMFYNTSTSTTPPLGGWVFLDQNTWNTTNIDTLGPRVNLGIKRFNTTPTSNVWVDWMYFEDDAASPSIIALVNKLIGNTTSYAYGFNASAFDDSGPAVTLIASFNLGVSGATIADADVRSAVTEIQNQRFFDTGTWTYSAVRDASPNPAASTYQAAGSITVGGSGQYFALYAKCTSTNRVQPCSLNTSALRIPFTP